MRLPAKLEGLVVAVQRSRQRLRILGLLGNTRSQTEIDQAKVEKDRAFAALCSYADDLMREHLRSRILAALRATREPMTAVSIARVLELKLYVIRRELERMQRDGVVGITHTEVPEGRAYRPVEIGVCEWCGLFDHHLVAGECPACRPSVQDVARPGQARRIC